jgi:hypothetical protein
VQPSHGRSADLRANTGVLPGAGTPHPRMLAKMSASSLSETCCARRADGPTDDDECTSPPLAEQLATATPGLAPALADVIALSLQIQQSGWLSVSPDGPGSPGAGCNAKRKTGGDASPPGKRRAAAPPALEILDLPAAGDDEGPNNQQVLQRRARRAGRVGARRHRARGQESPLDCFVWSRPLGLGARRLRSPSYADLPPTVCPTPRPLPRTGRRHPQARVRRAPRARAPPAAPRPRQRRCPFRRRRRALPRQCHLLLRHRLD